MRADPAIQVGDHVYIGAPGIGKVHWEVAGILWGSIAKLRSGMTGRLRYEAIAALALHTRP